MGVLPDFASSVGSIGVESIATFTDHSLNNLAVDNMIYSAERVPRFLLNEGFQSLAKDRPANSRHTISMIFTGAILFLLAMSCAANVPFVNVQQT